MAQPLHIAGAGRSDPGRVRENNEDSFLVLEPLGLFAVADGMGGHASGEVASKLAVESLQGFFTNPEVYVPEEPAAQSAFLGAAVRYANICIHRASRRDPDKRGMGTTIAAVFASRAHVHIAHVGDSRAYRLRGRRLERLTDDHTLLHDAVRRGLLTPAQADALPIRHVLTRALGTEEHVHVDVRREAAQDGDVVLLCSDGLTELVPETAIARVLRAHDDPGEAAHVLVEHANDRGGVDNVTCVIVRWTT